MFYGLGQVVYRVRWAVLAVWAILLLVSLPFLPRVSHVLKGGGFANGSSEADSATTVLVDKLGFSPSSLTIIFSSVQWKATDPRFRHAMQVALADATTLPSVTRVETYYDHAPIMVNSKLISDDGHFALAILDYSVSFDQVQNLASQVRATIHSSTLRVLVAGDGAVFGDIQRVSNRDLQKVETYTFPVALGLLVLIFGTLVASTVPMVTGAASVATTLAILYAIGRLTDLSIFALNTTSMIGLGVGIDYALFVVSRFREEVHHRPVQEAVAVTMSTAGRAVLFSGITVMIGLAGLLIFHSMALRSIGLGGSLVVLVSVISALTLLPALLSVLGPRIDALPLVPWRVAGQSPFWRALAIRVMRHPWPVIGVTLVIVAGLSLPIWGLQLSVPDATILPKSEPSRQGFDILNDRFHQQRDNPVVVTIEAQSNLLSPVHMAALYDYTHELARDPAVLPGGVKSLVTLSNSVSRSAYMQIAHYTAIPAVATALHTFVRRDATFITLLPRPGQSENDLESLVQRVRAHPLGGGLRRYVGGYNAGVMDYLANLYGQFPFTIAFVVVVSYLVLLIQLRSLILPLKAVLMNALSLLGAYGVVVWIFQQGHLSSVLNFSPTGYIDEITPIIMFCVLFGLSMDYEVFLLSRIREQYLMTGDNNASVALGLERTGRIITSAALILVVVAGSFSFTDIVLIKAVGLGVAVAILLDATLIRCLLAPATMRVLGQWNWWLPRSLRHVFGEKSPGIEPPPGERFVA